MNVLKLRKFVFLLLSFSVLGSSAYAENGGVIPLKHMMNNPARDLVDPATGLVISKRKAIRDAKAGKDLSKLNPKETGIWKGGKVELSESTDLMGIDEKHAYDYVDQIGNSDGTDAFRFTIRENHGDIEKRNRRFSVWLSKDQRSLLLRKNLLRKLGYTIQKLVHKDRLILKFKGVKSLEIFLEKINSTTYTTDRWKVSVDEAKKTVTLRDVIIVDRNVRIYDLETSSIQPETPQHRRVINALLIPYSVADLRESVDGLAWYCGKENNNQLMMSLYNGGVFTTTYNDAKWMLRKMAKLTRADYEKIVELSHFPPSVGKLLVEKLISRFNSIYKHFNMGEPLQEAKYEVSDEESGELLKGRLTKDTWEGHTARYSYDDTESPLAADEMRAFFKAKGLSATIENLVGFLNQNYLYNTDIQKEAIKRAIDAQVKADQDFFRELFVNNKLTSRKVPFSTWSIPTFRGNMNASRDIITGSYLGTDNRIQVADSLEYIGEAGVFVGTLGLPTGATAFGGANAKFSRSYTHVKSIKSIKKALKEPFKNILVPLLKRKKGLGLNGIISDLRDIQQEREKAIAKLEEGEEEEEEVVAERQERRSKVVDRIKKIIDIGESLIVSNNLVFSANANLGITWKKIDGILSGNVRKVNIWRLHIVRVSEQVIQVYRSKASTLGRGLGFNMRAIMPVVSLNFDKNSGKVDTKFNSISVNGGLDDSELIRNLKELKSIVLNNSLAELEKRKKPFTIKHAFTESTRSASFFHQTETRVKLLDELKLINPEGYEANILLRTTGKQKGHDYQKVAIDVVNGLISELIESDTSYSVSNPGSGNPGDSYKGHSTTRVATLELPTDPEEEMIPFEEYASVRSSWKGWKASKSDLFEVRDEIEEKYGKKLFSDDLLADTKEVQLYEATVTLSLYQRGIDLLIKYDNKKLKKLLSNDGILPWPKGHSHWRRKFSRYGAGRRVNAYKRSKNALINVFMKSHRILNGEYAHLLNAEARSKYLLNIINIAELLLPSDIFIDIVGGDQNIFIRGMINGFRVGPENGEEAILSHSIGMYGSEFPDGAFSKLKEVLGISPGELGAFWILRRLQ